MEKHGIWRIQYFSVQNKELTGGRVGGGVTLSDSMVGGLDEEVCSIVGGIVGAPIGTKVGPLVGRCVGLPVGREDGWEIGFFGADDEGWAVACLVGAVDGGTVSIRSETPSWS